MVMVFWRSAPLIVALLFLGAPPLRYAARHSESSCLFPEKWQGSWFQSGVRQPITILLNRFSTKGRCIAQRDDKYLIVHENGVCYRCVSIHEVHNNVLQYKETYCSHLDSLALCTQITGDALLYSMFRQNAVPLACPFTGYHTFHYNRGHGECNTLASTMEPCTQDSRLLLRYQACPDVYGSESAVEELQCLAMWKEGSSRYLVGKIEHGHATSNEDRYRCFVFDKYPIVGNGIGTGDGDGEVAYRVAQSGDATCNGLFSPMEGSRTMTLYKASSPSRCKFPNWVSAPGQWHTLDHRRSYSLRHRNTTLRIADSEGREETRVQCSEVKGPLAASTSGDHVQIVGHYTVGCQSGYVCMVFYKRDQHVLEVQSGSFTRRAEEACSKSNFDRAVVPYLTLVTSNPDLKPCPHPGRYSVTGIFRQSGNRREMRAAGGGAAASEEVESDDQGAGGLRDLDNCPLEAISLNSACTRRDTMELRSECDGSVRSIVSAYTCHAGWSENGTGFVITTPVSRSSHGSKRYCFVYSPAHHRSAVGNGAGQIPSWNYVRFSTSSDTCSRTVIPGLTGILAFNITSQGQCVEVSSSGAAAHLSTALLLIAVCLR
ncbi:uncharacterized protein LOC106663141 [Cimex lectularius]|uniref:Uncharacterized protein n=1 Tax=Cimex lectularius TaxID=79782 RepID=A0A8I6RCB1_CIMLE|nr:uncharacterized protein LOC106663141 [Cimex lectularius]